MAANATESFHKPFTTYTHDRQASGIRDGAGQRLWMNSVTVPWPEFKPHEVGYLTIGKEDGLQEFVQVGPKVYLSPLHLPVGYQQPPHLHPRGELAVILDGEYYDAGIDGQVLRRYPRKTTVLYNIGSTHRPCSRDGAHILYMAFDGVVFAKDPRELMQKIAKIGIPENAVEYALLWMFPDKAEAKRLAEELFSGRNLQLDDRFHF